MELSLAKLKHIDLAPSKEDKSVVEKTFEEESVDKDFEVNEGNGQKRLANPTHDSPHCFLKC